MKNSKIITALFILTCFSSPFFTKKAQAQWITLDVTNAAKEYGLDSIAFTIANGVIQRIAQSTVTWINSGFNGNPAFISNPSQYFGNLGNGIAGQLLYNNPNFKFMCSSFSVKVRLALGQSYRGNPQDFQCTLTGVVKNFDNFMTDFNQGGWDGFIQMTQNSNNNPIGLYNSWNNKILNEQNKAIDQKQNELNQGRGFLSYKKCVKSAPLTITDPGTDPIDITDPLSAESGQEVIENYDNYGVAGGNCLQSEIVTPGATIQGQLDKVLGMGTGRLEVADELNEIISSLLNQLVGKIVGGIGSGLRSLSSPDPSNNNQVYTNQLGNDATNQDTTAGKTCVLPDGSLGIPSGNLCLPDPTKAPAICTASTGTAGTINSSGQCVPNEGDPCQTQDSSGSNTIGVIQNGQCVAP